MPGPVVISGYSCTSSRLDGNSSSGDAVRALPRGKAMDFSRFCVAVCLMVALCAPCVYAQTEVSGQVLDAENGEPLIGVNVVAQGTAYGTTTDTEGRFVLRVDFPVRTLVFSYMGYQAKSIVLEDGVDTMTVVLEPRFMDLQPVIVSASREEERRTDAPVAVAVLAAQDLVLKKPDALHEVLSTLPGVHVTDLGNEQHNMSIRQPLSYQALYVYLEDGIPIRPVGIFNHNALIEVNMAGVDRVEVIRGPSSSLYGSNAIGGAINFITPRPSQAPTGKVSLRMDNNGYRRSDFEASLTSGKLGVWAGGYGARQRDGWAEHSDFDKLSLSLRTDYAMSSTTRLITTFSTNHLDTDTNGNLDSLNFYGENLSSLQTFTYRKVDASRLTSRLEHVWSGRHSTDVVMYWRSNAVGQVPHYRIRNAGMNQAAAWGELNEDRFWSLGLNVQHRTYFNWKQSRLIAGLSLDRSPNSYVAHYIDITRDPDSGRYESFALSDSLLTDYDVDLVNSAVYAQFEVSPIRRLKVVSSFRYDQIAYGYDNHLLPSAYSGAPDGKDRFTRVSPRAGFTFDLGRERGFYGNFSQGFLPPEVSELYRGVKVPTLKPAYFNNYEAGGWAAFLDDRLYLDLSLYHMEGTNEIISVLLDDGSVENRNAGKTRHTGIEYVLTYAPFRSLSLRFTSTNALHSFVRYEEEGQQLAGNRMAAAPTWMANAEVLYRPPFIPGTRAGLEWAHVGQYFMDPQNTMRYGGYDLVNLRLGYMVKGIELWMNVRNLTDVLYASIASKSRWGQQYNRGTPRSVSFGVGYLIGGR